MIKNAKMEESNLTLSTYVQYVEEFKFWVNIVVWPHRFQEKEIVKSFVSGLKPDIFLEEIYSRIFENLDDVIRETHEEISTSRYSGNFWSCQEIWAKKDFGKDKRDYPKSVVPFSKKTEANSTSGATFVPYKKSGRFGAKDDL